MVGSNPKTAIDVSKLMGGPDPKLQNRSLFERFGDKFEANSPQDIFTRVKRGDTAEYKGPKFWQQARDLAVASAREIPRTAETAYRSVINAGYARAADALDKAISEKDPNKRQQLISKIYDPNGDPIQFGRTKKLAADPNNIEQLVKLRDEYRSRYNTTPQGYTKGAKRFLYGSEPVQSYQQRYAGLKKELQSNTSTAQQILNDKGLGNVSLKAKQYAGPLAATLAVLTALTDTVLDPTDVVTKPAKKLFGGALDDVTEQAIKTYSTNTVKTLASEIDPAKIKKTLIDSGVSEATPYLDDMSKVISTTNSPKDVQSIISGFKKSYEDLDKVTVYRGGNAKEPARFVSENKDFAQRFADDTQGTVQSFKLSKADILDPRIPEIRTQIEGLLGKSEADRLLGKTPSGVFSAEDEMIAREVSQKLGKKGVAVDELNIGDNPKDFGPVKNGSVTYAINDPQALEQAVEALPPNTAISQQTPVTQAPEGVPSTSADIAQGQIVEPKKVGLKANLANKFIDEDYTIIQELKNIEKQTGQTGIVDKFMYESGLARHANSIATNRFTQAPEIQTALSGLGKDGLAEFNIYAAARRELANARDGLPTSRSIEELQSIVQDGAVYETRYNALRDYYRGLAGDMRDAGIIDEAKYQQFISDPDYIRLQRDFEDVFQTGQQGKSYQLGSTITSQKRTGSQREVKPVGETALNYTQKIQTEIQRNKVGKSLIEVLSDSGQAREISQKEAARRNVIKVLDNGSPRYFEVSKDMKEAVQRISPFQLDIVGRILAAPGRVFRAGTTGFNPVFVVKNLARDQSTQAIMSKDAVATSKYFLDSFGSAIKDFSVGNDDPLWNKFLQVAGDTTSYDLTRNIKKSSQVVNELAGAKNRYGNAILHPIRTLEDFASITEKSTRFQGFKGMYEKAIKEGASEQDALQQATLAAWQNTVDFNRAGQWGRVANLVFPYTNPSIQGSRQLVRRTSEAPVQTIVKGTAFVGTPLLVATLWNMSDEDRKAVYNNIPEYEKQNSLIIVPPGTKQNQDGTYDVLKFPLPPGLSNLYQPLRRGAEAAMGNPTDATKILGDVLEAFSGPIKISEPQQNVSTFTPQIIKPAVQATTNRDLFTGKKTVPDYIENADVPNQDKAYKNTSGTARFIGDVLNKSPIKVEKFIKDTFGTVGSQALNLSDRALVNAGKIPEEQIGGQSVAEGYRRAFSKAQGIENYNKSEGAKFYDNVASATKGLNKNEKAAFEGLVMPTRKGIDGVDLNEKTYYDSAAKATTWLKYPKVFEASKKLDQLQRQQGKPGDPLYDLPPDQLKIVLNLMANYSPGNFEEKAIQTLNPWIKDFNKKRSEYFDKVIPADKKGSTDAMGITIPKATPQLQTKLDQVSKITDKKQKAQYYADNPDITDYYKQTEDYQRTKRAFLGLPQFDRYPTASKEVQGYMDTYNALPKGNGPLKKDGTPSSPDRSAWIKSHPNEWAALTEQWAKQDIFNTQKEGAEAVYEGIDMEQDTIDKLAGALGTTKQGFYDQYGNIDKETALNLLKLLSPDKDYTFKSPDTKIKVQKVRYKIPKSVGKKSKVKLG